MTSDPAENAEQFRAVCQQIHEKHGRRSRSPEASLNRMVQKYFGDHHGHVPRPPELTPENTCVARETRSKLEFAKMAFDLHTGQQPSGDSGHSIIIARYGGADYLFDGNKRCRYWHKHGDTGPHEAYVLIVRA